MKRILPSGRNPWVQDTGKLKGNVLGHIDTLIRSTRWSCNLPYLPRGVQPLKIIENRNVLADVGGNGSGDVLFPGMEFIQARSVR
ncbi:MAG: hypothetical protein COS92_03695 [Desulfobacterales bacterium CG07_land_8_20_14_0_80_52_14]|nr:MAG: hypothetical protein COX20_06985 [Desulfobacterales bacterium CG23_combo_of_CG06-09_8_20_14_all_52_9]PIU49986.1 MAG: hypothetical protein COS92_03695 [Desulfobacterales bacterium CG07_land_8_20_14_0_80_52_14]